MALLLVAGFCVVAAWQAASWKLARLEAEKNQLQLRNLKSGIVGAVLDPATGKIHNAHMMGTQATAFYGQYRNHPIVSATVCLPVSEDMEILPRFEGLEVLQLEADGDHPPLAETDLEHLSNCKSLRSLCIRTPLTEDALSGLMNSSSLTSLELCDMEISRHMLLELEKLPSLQSLTIKANLPDGAVERLTAALPNCQIMIEDPESALVVGGPADPGGF